MDEAEAIRVASEVAVQALAAENGHVTLLDLVPVGVWLTLGGMAYRARQRWQETETSIERTSASVAEVGKKVDRVSERVGKLEETTSKHTTKLAFIEGQFDGKAKADAGRH